MDTSGLRPGGALAHRLFRVWTKTSAVVLSGWEQSNVGFYCGPFLAWRFCDIGTPTRLISRSPVPPAVKIVFDLAGVRGKVVLGFTTHPTLSTAKKDTTRPFSISATFCNRSTKAFQLNGKGFGPGALPTKHLQGIVALTLAPSLIRLEAPGAHPITAAAPADKGQLPALYFFLNLPAGAGGGVVKPCWSLLRD